MPNYDYRCPKCKQQFEKVCLPAAERDKQKCPSCKVKAIRVHTTTPNHITMTKF